MLFNKIEPNDCLQGAIGDCWLIAAIACVAEFHDWIRDEVFITKKIDGEQSQGCYRLRLYDASAKAWEDVTIDDKIPCKSTAPLE